MEAQDEYDVVNRLYEIQTFYKRSFIMAKKESVNTFALLEKYPGKGGWTYAAMLSIKPDKSNYFGSIREKGL